MVKMKGKPGKPPVYVNPYQILWLTPRPRKQEAMPQTRIYMKGGFSLTVFEEADTIQEHINHWFAARREA